MANIPHVKANLLEPLSRTLEPSDGFATLSNEHSASEVGTASPTTPSTPGGMNI